MKTLALVAAAGLATTASAQSFTTVLFNSFETTTPADGNEFATASVDDTSTQSLYPLNTVPLSPAPLFDSAGNVVEFPAGTVFQPVFEFDDGDVDERFDSPQGGLGIIDANFGFTPLEVNFLPVTSSDAVAVTGLPTTGDGRGSNLTEDTLSAVPAAFAGPNGFGSTAALSGLSFEGGDPSVETPFEVFFQDSNNFGNLGPVDFSFDGPGTPSAFFTGESTGDFIGTYPAAALEGFLSDLSLTNVVTEEVFPITETIVPMVDEETGEVLVETVIIDGEPVDFPLAEIVETVAEEPVEVVVSADIAADANFDGVVDEGENIGSQAYEFNDTDGSIILQFQTIPAAETTDFDILQLAFHFARNATGFEDDNLNIFTNDIDGDGEPDLLIDSNGDGIPDSTGNQVADNLRIFFNDTLVFEAGAEGRVQEIVDGASARLLALEFGLFDTVPGDGETADDLFTVLNPDNDGNGEPDLVEYFGFPNNVPTTFEIPFVPFIFNGNPFGPADFGELGNFLPDNSPLPFVPGPVDLDGDGDIGGSDLNGDGIVSIFTAPAGGATDVDGDLIEEGGLVLEQDNDETFSDQDPSTYPTAFFDFVDAQDGSEDGVLDSVIGPQSTARVLANIDSNTAGGTLPVIEFEDFLPFIVDVSDFIGEDITITVVGTTTAGSETLVIDNLTVRGAGLGCNSADVEADGDNDILDVLALLDAFNPEDPNCTGPFGAVPCNPADTEQDGDNDILDVLELLSSFDPEDPNCVASL